eukprot:CAMPEP_0184501712 /NCGR_PEP_ID=MMETSP0113_2-20130426/48406_1 /TAXON_ID=91329 /ORGANISM="Norrisiella sphaerica, Strain BC52" /LENGTH=334 /DNA_ID=CAMNT_0026890575 /DNA_START=245 /DNA_END=1249 /DNA_ORIENTATION=+
MKKWVPPSVRRKRAEEEALRKERETGREVARPREEGITVRSPDAKRVRFAVDDQVHIVKKLSWTQIRGDHRDPNGEDGPDYCFLGQERKTRLSGFYRNYLRKRAFVAWHTLASSSKEGTLDSFGSPSTQAVPISFKSKSSAKNARHTSLPFSVGDRLGEASARVLTRPRSFPEIGLDSVQRAGMKRDSPANAVASPSKRTCLMLDKLNLESPLFGRNRSSKPEERGGHIPSPDQQSLRPLQLPRSSKEGSERLDRKNRMRTLHLPNPMDRSRPCAPSSLTSKDKSVSTAQMTQSVDRTRTAPMAVSPRTSLVGFHPPKNHGFGSSKNSTAWPTM